MRGYIDSILGWEFFKVTLVFVGILLVVSAVCFGLGVRVSQ